MAVRSAASFALAVLAACVTHTRRVGVPGAQPVAAGLPDQMQAIARQALTPHPPGGRAPRTPYAPDPPLLGDAPLRLRAPPVSGGGYARRECRPQSSGPATPARRRWRTRLCSGTWYPP